MSTGADGAEEPDPINQKDKKMEYKKVVCEDAVPLFRFICRLDNSSEYMLFRPGERAAKGHDLKGHIKSLHANSAIFAAWDEQEIVGYLALYGGRTGRCAHVASLSCGVLPVWQGGGVASKLWTMAKMWAEDVKIQRVELTVVVDNKPAFKLYQKWGFAIEFIKMWSFKTDEGVMLPEYEMALILPLSYMHISKKGENNV